MGVSRSIGTADAAIYGTTTGILSRKAEPDGRGAKRASVSVLNRRMRGPHPNLPQRTGEGIGCRMAAALLARERRHKNVSDERRQQQPEQLSRRNFEDIFHAGTAVANSSSLTVPVGLLSMPYRLIALDIDGTIRTHGSPISDRAKKAIERVREEGAIVTLATGRTFKSALRSAEELKIVSPVAAFQGAQISDPETRRVLWRRPLTAAMARRALSALEGWPVEVMAHHEDDVYVSRMTQFADGYRDRNGVNVETVDDLRELADWNLTRLVVVADEDEAAKLNAHLRRTHGGELYVTRSLPHFCEILSPAGGKEKALSWICQCLGIDRAEVLAFGNGYNDVPMLKWAGLGVAVGDVVDEAKDAADDVGPGIEEDGVAQVLDSMLEAGQIG